MQRFTANIQSAAFGDVQLIAEKHYSVYLW